MSHIERQQGNNGSAFTEVERALETHRLLILRQQAVAGESEDPAALQRMRDRWMQQPQPEPGIVESTGWFTRIARLIVPVAPQMGFSGIRGIASNVERYEVDGGSMAISLRSTRHAGEDRLTIYGAVSRRDEGSEALEGARVELLEQGAGVWSTGLDDLGHFILEAVPEGIYTLQVQFADQQQLLVQDYAPGTTEGST